MSKKTIALDCDGVLLDWHGGFIDWVEQNYGWYLNHGHPHDTYDMQDWFEEKDGKKMSKEDFVTLVKKFNGFPRCLKPLDEVKDALLSLKKRGYNLTVVTAFGSCPDNCSFREDYLNIIFDGVFSDIIILGLGDCKEEVLKSIDPIAFVEDNATHARKAVGLGIDTYLVSYAFNQGVDGATYVKDLGELAELVYFKDQVF